MQSIDFQEYLDRDQSSDSFKLEILSAIERFPSDLSREEKAKVLQFGDELWQMFQAIDDGEAFRFETDFDLTAEQRKRLNENLEFGFHSLVVSRNRFIQYLIARLVFQKIKIVSATRKEAE